MREIARRRVHTQPRGASREIEMHSVVSSFLPHLFPYTDLRVNTLDASARKSLIVDLVGCFRAQDSLAGVRSLYFQIQITCMQRVAACEQCFK